MKKVILLFVFLFTVGLIQAQCWQSVHGFLGVKTNGTLWSMHSGTLSQQGSDNNWDKLLHANNSGFLALKNDGTLWSGLNTQVGTDSWITASKGQHCYIGIKNDGTLWAWGYLTSSQETLQPLQIGTDNTWINASAGSSNFLAIKSDGTLWGFGTGGNSQLGNGGQPLASLTQIGSASNWASVSLGLTQAIALKTNGTLWGWGINTSGATGIQTDSNVPVQIGSDNNWASVSANSRREIISGCCAIDRSLSMATKNDHSVWLWGMSMYGFNNNNVPTQVLDGSQQWQSIAAGTNQGSAISSAGKWWWVYTSLGNGPIPVEATPCSALGLVENEQIAFSVYPNPVQNILHLQTSAAISGYTIYNLQGQSVQSATAGNTEIEVSDLASGLYFIEIKDETQSVARKKFIKE